MINWHTKLEALRDALCVEVLSRNASIIRLEQYLHSWRFLSKRLRRHAAFLLFLRVDWASLTSKDWSDLSDRVVRDLNGMDPYHFLLDMLDPIGQVWAAGDIGRWCFYEGEFSKLVRMMDDFKIDEEIYEEELRVLGEEMDELRSLGDVLGLSLVDDESKPTVTFWAIVIGIVVLSCTTIYCTVFGLASAMLPLLSNCGTGFECSAI